MYVFYFVDIIFKFFNINEFIVIKLEFNYSVFILIDNKEVFINFYSYFVDIIWLSMIISIVFCCFNIYLKVRLDKKKFFILFNSKCFY